ncbi:PREDICTED: uncharacterized protein LOC107336086 [Acropora digitifera]|uniref:uncharacterized protein LOC107336086 n=1 Tax=Acropora digitifera TaxID=70779 RepID=UPI00077A2DB3|nr:PREDICTED: uncharacterized protein LOC107336086 [Acropora digitifera]
MSTFNYTTRVERVYNVGSTVMRHAVQVSFPHFNIYLTLLGWLDFILSLLINPIRFSIPQLISKMISTLSRAIAAIVSHLSPWLRTLIILIRSSLQLFVRVAAKLLFRGLCLLYRVIPSKVAVFLGRCFGVYPVAFAFFLCRPSLEILPNVLLTGNFYPGSLIR